MYVLENQGNISEIYRYQLISHIKNKIEAEKISREGSGLHIQVIDRIWDIENIKKHIKNLILMPAEKSIKI